MNPRIEKLMEERKRATDRIDNLKGKIKDLNVHVKNIDRKIVEIQNTEIIGVFQELNMTPDEFAAFAAERKTAAAGRGGEDEED